jgi:hypothetical protein
LAPEDPTLTAWSNSIAGAADVGGLGEDVGPGAGVTVGVTAGVAIGEPSPSARLDDRSRNVKYAVAGTATPIDATRNRRLVYGCWERLG